MPLARILTFDPQDAAPLFAELQRLGFHVEVLNPNEEQLAPADLEIEFAICDQQQVLARASAIAAQLQARVVVFPGAIPPLPKPVNVIAEIPVSVPPPREAFAERPQPQDEPAHAEREFDLYIPAESWTEGLGEKLRRIGQQAASGCRRLAGSVRSGMQRLRPVIGNGLTRLKTGIAASRSAVADRTREYHERIKLRAAEARAARRQRLEETEKQRAAMLEQARQNPTAATQQSQSQIDQAERQKRLAEMERVRAEAREQVAAMERARLAAEAEHERSRQQHAEEPLPQRRVKVVRPQPSQLRGVFTGAVAASILFIVGMLLANFHPTTPLPVNLTNGSVEEQVPFGATTVRGTPGVTVGGQKASRPAPAIKNPQPPAPQLKPEPAKRSAPAAKNTGVAKKKTQWHSFRKGSKENDVADDVVVRHYASPQKPVAKNTQQQAGLKRYSDQ